jgi:acetate---CoA ligase (ADP-forming)
MILEKPAHSRREARQANLCKMMRPKRIAFIGGSQIVGPLRACLRAGYDGEISIVNPFRETVEGIACTRSIADLLVPPDAVVLALSPERTVEAVRELALIGAAGAVAMAAGFAELGPAGRALQGRLIEAAGDMAVMGPNCMGILNQFDGAAVWGENNHIERVVGSGCAIVSQSGAFLFGITNVEQVFPLGYAMSTGNQAIVDMADCIEALLSDDRVNAIGLYLEGVDDGVAFGNACARAMAKGVPIVAIKGGDTDAGESIAVSHTAAMVVERDLWDAFRDRYQIEEVDSPKALVETLKYLAVCGVPSGNRLAAVSFSGGLNGLIASQAIKAGLKLLPPLPENKTKLRALMPETVPISNPLDLNLPFRSSSGMSMEDGASVGTGIIALASGVADHVVFFVDVPRPDESDLDKAWLPSIEAMVDVAVALKVPCAVAGILPEGLDVGLRRRLMDVGVAPLLGFSDTLTALAVSSRIAARRAAKREVPAPLIPGHVQGAAVMFDEVASKEMLASHGLAIPNFAVANSGDAAARSQKLGFPVVLKVLSAEISHKARVGGVALHLSSAEDMRIAMAKMKTALTAALPDMAYDRFMIEEMIAQPRSEYIVGAKRDPALGLALMIGLGGSNVEAQSTFRLVLLPATAGDLERAITSLGIGPAHPDHAPLLQAANAVLAFVMDKQDQVITLDVNPIIITQDNRAIAADAVIVLAQPEA